MEKIPFRLIRREGRPLLLEVEITNTKKSPRKYVVRADTEHLSFSPSGAIRTFVKKTENVLPGSKTYVSIKVYPRPTTKEGTYTVSLTVDECVDSYEYVDERKVFNINIPVV